MPKSAYIYSDPTISTSANGDTPYGLYDSDDAFVSESVDVAKYVSRKLGHPVMQLEFNSSSIYACFEEATSDYSQYINNYNVKIMIKKSRIKADPSKKIEKPSKLSNNE